MRISSRASRRLGAPAVVAALAAFGAALPVSPAALHAQPQSPPESTPDFRAEFNGQFEASARKLVALAEAMPAENYSWQPMEGVASVAQAYMHVARYNYMYPDQNLGVAPPDGVEYETLEESVVEKEQVVAVLSASVDHVRDVVADMSDADLAAPTRLYGREVASWAVLFQLVAHMNEHLGQQIAYARMNRVAPPWSR